MSQHVGLVKKKSVSSDQGLRLVGVVVWFVPK